MKGFFMTTAAGIALLLAGCSGQSQAYSNGYASAVAVIASSPSQQVQTAITIDHSGGMSIPDLGTVQGGSIAIAAAYLNDSPDGAPVYLPTAQATATQLCQDAQQQGNDPASPSYNADWLNGCIAGLEGH
jgi:hypothetical protein